ncbi:MAG: TIM barrel protein [Planctomycetaceae bacterium]|nr:TIM barrel protein [Planctomycetaceae bacterium]
MPSRRQFLRWTGGTAAASLSAGSILAQGPLETDKPTITKSSKPEFELGLASYTFLQFPLEKCLAMTARVGLKHICLKDFHLPLSSAPERIAEAAAKVRAAGLDLYGCGVIAMHKPADIDRAFQYAKAAGVRVIVCAPFAELLPRLDECVRKYNIRAAIHNHGPGDKIFPTPDVVYEKIERLDRRVGLCIDIGHTTRAGVDAARAIERFADRLVDVHIKDVTSATAAGACTEAGRGVINMPRIIAALIRSNYSGIASFEFEKDPADPLPGLAESVGYVNGVMRTIGNSGS